MRMLRRIKGVTLRDKVKSGNLKGAKCEQHTTESKRNETAGMDTCRELKKTTK